MSSLALPAVLPCAHPPAPADFGIDHHVIVDADVQAGALRGWQQSFDQLGAGAYSGCTLDVRLGPMQLFREVNSRALRQQGRAPQGHHLFALAAGVEARFRGSLLTQEAMMSVAQDSAFEIGTPAGFVGYGLAVPTELLHQHAEGLGSDGLKACSGPDGLVHAGARELDRMRQLLATVLERLQRQPALLASAPLRQQLAAQILDQLCEVLHGAVPAPAHQRTQQRHARLVMRAEAYALAQPFGAVSVAELCRHVGASRRQLQYAFEGVVGLSPNRYLRAVRLCRVRRALKARPAADDSIQDIAARWGFWHVGHFAQDYRRLFGERPSDTLRCAAH